MVLTSDDFQPGAKFISDSEWPLQVGLMVHLPGHTIPAHFHLPRPHPQNQPAQEFLLVMSGKMEVSFFDESGHHFQTETLEEGNALFHIRGGHAFRFLEPTRLIEVKSGPYWGRDKDKALLDTNGSAVPVRPGAPRERNSV